MQPQTASPQPHTPQPEECPPAARTCPVCGGPFIPLRGQSRCSRCHFALCEGCEGGTAED